MLTGTSEALARTASQSSHDGSADIATATRAAPDAASALSPLAPSAVSFLPLSPSSSNTSRALPPSPALSSALSVSAYPLVVYRPRSCEAVVLFDPSSQQLTLYKRRRRRRSGRRRTGASSVAPFVRHPLPLYLPDAKSKPAAASSRRRKKRKRESSAGSDIAADGDVCPTCGQQWPQPPPADRRHTQRRFSDSAACARPAAGWAQQASDSSDGGGGRAAQYTVTELEDEGSGRASSDDSSANGSGSDDSGRSKQRRSPRFRLRRDRLERQAEWVDAEQSVPELGGVSGGSGGEVDALTPFASPDYFHLLSYTFLREQRDRQRQNPQRFLQRAARPTKSPLLAIDDGTGAAAEATREAGDERKWTGEGGQARQQQQLVPKDESEGEFAEAAMSVHRGLLLGPARTLPALLPSAASDRGEGSDVAAASGEDDDSPDATPILSSASRNATVGGLSHGDGGDSGSAGASSLQQSSFVTGYYDRFFVRVRKLGSGTYGAVWLTCHLLEGVQLGHYACKIIPVGDSKAWLQRVVAEVRALESVHHRHVVSYRHSWLEMAQLADFGPPVPALFLLMQYCDLGTVAQLVWPKDDTAAGGASDSGKGKPAVCDERAPEQHSRTELHSPYFGSQSVEAGIADKQREQIERIRATRRSAKREQSSEEYTSSTPPSRASGAESDTEPATAGAAPTSASPSPSASVGRASGEGVAYLLESDVWWIFLDTCLGLRHLHRCGILHMDLKLDNLLLTADRDARGRVQGRRVLLSDMGNAVIKGDQHQRTGNTGTMQYAAPETLLDPPAQPPQRMDDGAAETTAANLPHGSAGFAYSEKSDLWSLGVCLYSLCYSALPYEADSAAQLYAIIHSQPLHIPQHPRRSPELVALITALLSVDPHKRPESSAILNHPHIRRRREERQSNTQQRHDRAEQSRSDSARAPAAVEDGADELAARQRQQQQRQRPPSSEADSHAAVLPKGVAASSGTHAAASAPQPEQTALVIASQRRAAARTQALFVQNGSDRTSSPERVSSSPLSSDPPVEPRAAMSALAILRSSTALHSPRAQTQSLQQSKERAGVSASQLAVEQTAQLALVAAQARTKSEDAFDRLALPAALRAVESLDCETEVTSATHSALLSDRALAALRGCELLGHACVMLGCAASASIAATTQPTELSYFPRWLLPLPLPSTAVVLRACLLSPLVVLFSECLLSLTLSALLPAEVAGIRSSASPWLRHITLSAAGRACAAVGMILYTALLATLLN